MTGVQQDKADVRRDLADVVTLRPIAEGDMAFLYDVYASTRAAELAAVPWDDAQKAAFLRMQFTAQHKFYEEQYLHATFDVVLIEGQRAGRLYVNRGADEHRIVDIAILPEFRNRRIGSWLLNVLQAEAESVGKALRIHVERFNPALRLYDRLGFVPIADRGVYLFMEWRPATT